MVFFGSHRNQSRQEAGLARKARNPYASTSSSPLRFGRKEVGTDGDLDDLCEQEIQRYEELFESSNRDPYAGPADDDTLMDGSIYTSTQTLQGASAILPPAIHRNASLEDAEDESIWGLPDPYKLYVKPARTSLLTPKEEAAAARVDALKKKPKKPVVDADPPLPTTNISVPKENETKTTNTTQVVSRKEVTAKKSPPPTKKTRKKSLFARMFRSSNKQAAHSTSKHTSLPSLTQQQQQESTKTKTPDTQVSTPSSKTKFFSPGKRLFQKNPSVKKKHHLNLLLASYKSNNAAASNGNKNEDTQNESQQTQQQQQQQKQTTLPPSPSMDVKCSGPNFFPLFRSPPPPIDNFDACSVISAQSSLTDVLDAWQVSNSPPKIIGGDHLQQPQNMTHRLEVHDGGISPHAMKDSDNDSDYCVEEEKKEEADVVESLAAVRLTEAGLYYHNAHSDYSESKKSEDGSSSRGGLIHSVLAIKQERDKRREEKAILQEEVSPEDADVQELPILGLMSSGSVEGQKSAGYDVKRNLFGDDKGTSKIAEELSLESVGEVAASNDDELEEADKSVEEVREIISDAKESKAEGGSQADQQHISKKPSMFKTIAQKFAHASPQRNRKRQQKLEEERLRTQQAETERNLQEEKEARRIERKRQQELERQRKLEKASRKGASRAAGNFSLMTGTMKNADCSTSFTAEETSHPASSRSHSRPESPSTTSLALCVHCESNARTHIVIPCMHYTLCDECVGQAREISTEKCHCHTCDTTGFLFARVGVLQGQELQEKLLEQATPSKAAKETLQALAFQ